MASSRSCRALHFVFKVANRKKTADFYRNVLGMSFLRHEEFDKGCEAMCNGPYDGKWSKSMVGYGPEDDHFVVELTYNYGVGSYPMGNDFQGLWIHSKAAVARARQCTSLETVDTVAGATLSVLSPSGYKFHLVDEDVAAGSDPVKKVSLAVSNMERSVAYWRDLCGMTLHEQDERRAVLSYGANQCQLELVGLSESIQHAKAFGRIAFACPAGELPAIQAAMEKNAETVLTPLLSLDTPGKATVQVVIVADPDAHEICFVGDEAFRELSQIDAQADALLSSALDNDKSDEWFAKKGKSKAVA